jgi:hypothetical protein
MPHGLIDAGARLAPSVPRLPRALRRKSRASAGVNSVTSHTSSLSSTTNITVGIGVFHSTLSHPRAQSITAARIGHARRSKTSLVALAVVCDDLRALGDRKDANHHQRAKDRLRERSHRRDLYSLLRTGKICSEPSTPIFHTTVPHRGGLDRAITREQKFLGTA